MTKMTPFADRELTQVFVRDCATTREEDGGLVGSGTVEIGIRNVDGTAGGPSIAISVNVPVVSTTTVEQLPKLLIARAMELVHRISREPLDTLVAMEALPYEQKWHRVDVEE